jgi:hypothetical protein
MRVAVFARRCPARAAGYVPRDPRAPQDAGADVVVFAGRAGERFDAWKNGVRLADLLWRARNRAPLEAR